MNARNILQLKLALLLPSFLVACMFLSSSCKSPSDGKLQSDRTAIQNVIGQFSTATATFSNALTVLAGNDLKKETAGQWLQNGAQVFQDYADHLREINISGCPEDFQSAFLKYYRSLDGLKSYLNTAGDLGGVITDLLKTNSIFWQPNPTASAFRSVENAWRELDLICTKYEIASKKTARARLPRPFH